MRFLFVLIFVFFNYVLLSQSDSTGNVQIIQDSRVDTLLEKYIAINEYNPGIEGWRIQIFFEAGNYSKRMAIEAKSEFVNQYSDIPVYVIFQQPYYKVRIGDYRTRIDAEKFLKKIERKYPNAFVVRDEINFPRMD